VDDKGISMDIEKKPSRRELLKIISALQDDIGEAIGQFQNDRET
jgi:hypothetical protein